MHLFGTGGRRPLVGALHAAEIQHDLLKHRAGVAAEDFQRVPAGFADVERRFVHPAIPQYALVPDLRIFD